MPTPNLISGMNASIKPGRGQKRHVGDDLDRIQVGRTRHGTVVLTFHREGGLKDTKATQVTVVLPPHSAELLGAALLDPTCGRLVLEGVDEDAG